MKDGELVGCLVGGVGDEVGSNVVGIGEGDTVGELVLHITHDVLQLSSKNCEKKIESRVRIRKRVYE